MRSPRRALAFVIIAGVSAMSLLAGAQPKKPAAVSSPPKRPPVKATRPDVDAAAAPTVPKDERASMKDAGVTEARTLDGGTRVFRFGEVEVEGRLKSPQIVYFLRRVRAEFAAGDLGHRSFLHELSETRNEPGF